MIKNFILVGLGGCIGSMLRYGLWMMFKHTNFPYATLLVNIIGSFVIGLVISHAMKDMGGLSQQWKLFIATGICGGFTTFSAFTIENLQMLQNGKYLLSLLYIGSSIIAGIIAAWIGFKLGTN